MNPLKSVDAFELDNQVASDRQINSVATVQLKPLELNGLRMLQLELDFILSWLMSKTQFVGPFKQSWDSTHDGPRRTSIAQPITRFERTSQTILRALRVLRGYQNPAAIKSAVEHYGSRGHRDCRSTS
jgi:hypothetical protein